MQNKNSIPDLRKKPETDGSRGVNHKPVPNMGEPPHAREDHAKSHRAGDHPGRTPARAGRPPGSRTAPPT